MADKNVCPTGGSADKNDGSPGSIAGQRARSAANGNRIGGAWCAQRTLPILAVALALRLGFAVLAWWIAGGEPLVREPDSFGYVKAAENLARHSRFTIDGAPEIQRTPLYPVLLVPGVWMGAIDVWAIVLQAALGTATVYFVYRTVMAIRSDAAAAAWAAWLAACEPVSILYCGKLLSETTFAALVAAAVCLTAQYVARPAAWRVLTAALLIAAAALVRPIAYYLPAVLAATLCVANAPPAWRDRRVALHAVVLLLVAQAPLWAWQIRNRMAADYNGFSAIADVNLYFWNAAAVRARQEGADWRDVQERMGYTDDAVYLRLHPEQTDWPPARRFAFYRNEARRILSSDPLGTLVVQLSGVADVLIDPGTSGFTGYFRWDEAPQERANAEPRASSNPKSKIQNPKSNDESLAQRIARVVRERPGVLAIHAWLWTTLIIYGAAALYGLADRRVRTSGAAWIVVAVFLYLLLLSGGPIANHRFRVPLEPMICVLAGCGLSRVRSDER